MACKGPEGPIEPKEPTGDQGAIGSLGAAGAMGAIGATGATYPNEEKGSNGDSDVRVSEWHKMSWGKPVVEAGTNLPITFQAIDTQLTEITQEVLYKAAILIYVKTKNTALNDNGDYELQKIIIKVGTNNSYGSYIKRPSKKLVGYESSRNFTYGYVYNFNNLGVNFLKPSFQLYTTDNSTYDPKTGKYSQYDDLINKTESEYTEILKVAVQIRTVIIMGGVKAGGRLAAIDYNNYNEVKKTFNLKD